MTENLPTVGIDCRFVTTQSGIGRYTRELVTHLLLRDDPWRYVFFVNDVDRARHTVPLQTDRATYYSLLTTHYSLSEQIKFPKAIKKSNIDLLHIPHFNVPLRCPVPFITTIHDLILHHYPNQTSLLKRVAYRKLMKHAVKKSSHIISVSNFTADDIAKTYGGDVRNKITVTYEGVSPQFHQVTKSEIDKVCLKYSLPTSKRVNELTSKQSGGFILYVGTAKEHKNVQILINAVSDDPLVLVTSGKEVSGLKTKPNVTIVPQVDDEDLPAIYSSAKCFVTPSLYEGFGLPALEAMACGCKVVASDRGSLPEILGKDAIFTEPEVDAIRNGIEQTQDLKSKTQEGIKHASSFSWEKMAEQTANTYKALLKV
jgi:glycosyltransferase involved in cell wall biosynthesis